MTPSCALEKHSKAFDKAMVAYLRQLRCPEPWPTLLPRVPAVARAHPNWRKSGEDPCCGAPVGCSRTHPPSWAQSWCRAYPGTWPSRWAPWHGRWTLHGTSFAHGMHDGTTFGYRVHKTRSKTPGMRALRVMGPHSVPSTHQRFRSPCLSTSV